MKYLLGAITAFALTACQQGPLVKSPPLDVEKMIFNSAKWRCRDNEDTELYAKCFDRELAKSRRDVKMIEAHSMPKTR